MTPYGYFRRYSGKRPSVAHLFHEMDYGNANQWYRSLCGLSGDMWQGSGTQDEEDLVKKLRLCRTCEAQVTL